METQQLRYFAAVCGGGSLARAAMLCLATPDAVAAGIARLEEELGHCLFADDGDRLCLTEFGRLMEPLLHGVLERAEAARGAAESLRQMDRPPVRLGVMPSLGPMRFAAFLAELEAMHPGMEVSIREGRPAQLGEWLEEGALDAAILNPVEQRAEAWQVELLYRERYVVLLPSDHPLGAMNQLTLEDLSGQSYVDRLACELRDWMMTTLGERNVQLYARYRSERDDWVQAMVVARLGFAFLPEHSITHAGAIQRPLVDPAVRRDVVLATMPDRARAPTVANFIRAARNFRWLG